MSLRSQIDQPIKVKEKNNEVCLCHRPGVTRPRFHSLWPQRVSTFLPESTSAGSRGAVHGSFIRLALLRDRVRNGTHRRCSAAHQPLHVARTDPARTADREHPSLPPVLLLRKN